MAAAYDREDRPHSDWPFFRDDASGREPPGYAFMSYVDNFDSISILLILPNFRLIA